VKSLGDGVLTFVPDPGAALRSAVEQPARFAEVGSVERPLWVRTGVHFGSPLRRGDDFVGHDVNLAARVADQAMPGEVLATYETVVAAGHGDGARPPGLVIGEVGPVFVKGVDDPVRLFRVSGMPMKTG
jgi:class 3 adenylate cyclase